MTDTQDARHTPGPWVVIDKGEYFSIEWKPELKVCRTYGNSVGDKEDAEFLAQAPALAAENARLRACLQDMTDALAKYIHEQDGSDPEKAPRIMAARAELAQEKNDE